MKRKDVLTKRFAYEYNELDSVAEMLEQKAAEGWELTSKTGVAFGFRKCEPKKVKISVELVIADQNDIERKRFIEYCEAGGWRHIFDDGKIQIFETEDLDAEPIHTDQDVKLAMIHKKCIGMRAILPIVIAIFIGFFCMKMLFPIDAYTCLRWSSVLPIIGFPMMGLMMAAYAGDYWLWYKRAKACVAKGDAPIYKKTRITAVADKVMLAYIFGGMWGAIMLDAIYSGDVQTVIIESVCFGMVLLFIILFPWLSAKYNRERSGNMALYVACAFLTIIVFTAIQFAFGTDPDDTTADEMPLTLADLGIQVEEETSFWKSQEGTFIAKSMYASETIQKDYSEDDDEPFDGMNYQVFTTRYGKAYDLILEDCFSSYIKDYKEIQDSAFGANKVYYSQDEAQWLLLYDEHIIEFSCSFDLTDAQKKFVAERLIDEY